MSKRLGSFIILGLILLFTYMGYDYLHYRSKNAVSDAAFIKSDNISMVGFKVGGKVIEMKKNENEAVRKGELLALIDPVDFITTKEKLIHSIKSLEKSIEAMRLKKIRLEKSLELRRQIAGTDIEILNKEKASLRYTIEAAKTRLKKLDKDVERFEKMLEQKLIASTDYESVKTNRDALADEIEAMEKKYEVLSANRSKVQKAYQLSIVDIHRIKEIEKQIEAQVEQLKAQTKSLEAIENKIGYTKLYAPFDGIVAKKLFDAPHVVEKGSPVYAIADLKTLYCEVLLSEKKLHGVEPGNDVTIKVDAVKGKEYHGKVESIAPTSASTFSLVPRDIASGEFTKLDQRFVVRITLDTIEGLRAGMGATVAIERN
ncbi:HlyD family secretion protein [Hydrogenimonas cancrithermarum]|uniref:Multidrug resistance protein MdtA-like barrel-sandwich hybrid domain-containing protein n=1 Tax=Hydrogenimonas cancrithermarum TaxID=2993563 RepID=A0ABN6WSL0_9BACT|nr:efflux RND transporter periplasmic adaptor subunit [Hydrogenimonas cancrithermarum]BDY11806.1 hypothetical protein HCR_01180 [Hydrogenimonas cancrithermarum]